MNKDIREIIYKWDIWEKEIWNLDKKVFNKYIETIKVCERYQIDFVTLSEYLFRDKKILLNYVDHFFKIWYKCSNKKIRQQK